MVQETKPLLMAHKTKYKKLDQLRYQSEPVEDVRIMELRDYYYLLYIPGIFEKIFCCQLQGLQFVKKLFDLNYLNSSQRTSLSNLMIRLPLPFTNHSKNLSKEECESIEKDQRKAISDDFTKMYVFEKVLATKEPQLGLQNNSDGELVGYVLTKRHQSNFFTTFAQGRKELTDMLDGYYLSREEYRKVIKKIFSVFGNDIRPLYYFHNS